MAHTKLTARKQTIVMPTRRMRFTLGKHISLHLVEAPRDMEEEPQEVQPMEVPMEGPLEDELEDAPIDEEAEDEPMFEEPIEVEDSEVEPMEYYVQEGAGDPEDGDDSDDSDSDGDDNEGDRGDNGDDGGDDGGNDGGDGGDGEDGGNGGDGGNDYHATLLAKGWSMEIHFDLHGDAYYHPSLPCTPLPHQVYRIVPDEALDPPRLHRLLGYGDVHMRKESGVPHPPYYHSLVHTCSCHPRCC
jgi:hypothetical protein